MRLAVDADDFVAMVRLALVRGGPGTPRHRMQAVARASCGCAGNKLIELAEDAAARRGRQRVGAS
jgi:hypothetical protein